MKNKKKLIATCIEWDTDGEDVDLPNEVCIPDEVIPSNVNRTEYMEEYAEEVENWLSNTYGFCVYGFMIEEAD